MEHQCGLCGKCFDRRDLRERHRRRCERSSERPRKAKQKSCGACAKSKTACDQLRPHCSRCIGKGIECQYAAGSGSAQPLLTVDWNEHENTGQIESPGYDDTLFLSDARRTSMSTFIPSNSVDLTIRLPEYLRGVEAPSEETLGTSKETMQITAPQDSNQREKDTGINLLASFGIPFTEGLSQESETTRDSRFETFTWYPPLDWDELPGMQEVLDLSGGTEIEADTPVELGQSLTGPLQLHTSLKDYSHNPVKPPLANDENWVEYIYEFPQMMLRAGTYPPFVHPSIYRCSEGEVIAPLAIAFCCLGSYNAAMRSSQKFAFLMIDKEREQLIKDFPSICSKPDIWVLASVHAMCVYQIVGFFGTSPEQVLVAQLQQPWLLKMTRYLARIQVPEDPCAPEETWETWALSETIRRTIMLVNSINSLSYRVGRQDPRLFESLDDELVFQLPLPAAENLWRAKTAADWRSKRLSIGDKDIARANLSIGTAFSPVALAHTQSPVELHPTDPDKYSRMVVDLSRPNLGTESSWW